ncbi:MAG: hypothetical protein HY862_09470 [Chloroflexi bacterium]|nr:hypothetical protein [Chloroflexota bacterium]
MKTQKFHRRVLVSSLVLMMLSMACSLQAEGQTIPTEKNASLTDASLVNTNLSGGTAIAAAPQHATSTSTRTFTPFPSPTASITPSPSLTQAPTITAAVNIAPIATVFTEPTGCMKPPDDYTQIQIGNATLNARTYWMLQHAQQFYSGTIPITGEAITQGSYNPGGVGASFGTHDGGGAVDISVRNLPYDWTIKWDDIPLIINALQLAGFAAWYRDERENLPPHIHAIAIGDAELSPAAQLQLTGRYGYFRGYDGFPREDGIPLLPRYGGMVICQWMLDMGYYDMRGEPLPAE